MTGTLLKVKKYVRSNLKTNPTHLYVFGDNMEREGFGGQAKECRMEPNAVGIPTKWSPSMKAEAFFSDKDFDRVKIDLDIAFHVLSEHLKSGGTVVLPVDGIGTGLANLEIKSPLIFEYIQKGLADLEKVAEQE